MRDMFLIAASFFLIGCMGTAPEPDQSKSSIAGQEIQDNQVDAQIAQKEYIELQKLHRME